MLSEIHTAAPTAISSDRPTAPASSACAWTASSLGVGDVFRHHLAHERQVFAETVLGGLRRRPSFALRQSGGLDAASLAGDFRPMSQRLGESVGRGEQIGGVDARTIETRGRVLRRLDCRLQARLQTARAAFKSSTDRAAPSSSTNRRSEACHSARAVCSVVARLRRRPATRRGRARPGRRRTPPWRRPDRRRAVRRPSIAARGRWS